MIKLVHKTYGYKITNMFGSKLGEIITYDDEPAFISKKNIEFSSDELMDIAGAMEMLND